MSAAELEPTVMAPYALSCAECDVPPGEPCRPGCPGEVWPTEDGAGAIYVERDGHPHWQPAGRPCATCGGHHGPSALAVV